MGMSPDERFILYGKIRRLAIGLIIAGILWFIKAVPIATLLILSGVGLLRKKNWGRCIFIFDAIVIGLISLIKIVSITIILHVKARTHFPKANPLFITAFCIFLEALILFFLMYAVR